MKKSTKAALLSGLVFPGAGQMYLKRWVSGALLAGIAAYAIYTVVSVVMRVTREVVLQVESGAVAASVESLSAAVTQQLSGSEQATDVATTTFMVCWIVGIVGAYIQGHLQERWDTQAGHGAIDRDKSA